jgi:ketosteroid isomerase-like protein
MRKAWLWGTVGLLSLAAAQAQTSAIEKTLVALEQKWLDATKASDPAPVAPLLADKFVNVSDGKVLDRASVLAQIKVEKLLSGGYEGVKVSVFGDTAIVTGVLSGKNREESGKLVDLHLRFVDTWVKMPGGKWQCVANVESPF